MFSSHHESDGCARGFSFIDATQEVHFISLFSIGGDATLPRPPPVELVLHKLHIDVDAGRHAINYPTDSLSMAFTKGCQRENMAKCVPHHRGGGRSSARVTLSRCVAGALAKLVLRRLGITIQAYVSQVGDIALQRDYRLYDLSKTESSVVRCPDEEKAKQMEQFIRQVKVEGDTVGGIVTCVIKGCPVGLGEPEFDKLHAQLGAAMLSINATKGFEYGEGFACVSHRGSEMNDPFVNDQGRIQTATNHNGGIQAGISNGEDIYFRVAFKPVATILMEQQTVDVEGHPTAFKASGRHDSRVVPRAVPLVEAMAAMVILDNYLLDLTVKEFKY